MKNRSERIQRKRKGVRRGCRTQLCVSVAASWWWGVTQRCQGRGAGLRSVQEAVVTGMNGQVLTRVYTFDYLAS